MKGVPGLALKILSQQVWEFYFPQVQGELGEWLHLLILALQTVYRYRQREPELSTPQTLSVGPSHTATASYTAALSVQ